MEADSIKHVMPSKTLQSKTMKHSELWLPILIGVLATPICFALGAFLSGGGHSLAPMILLFPFGMLLGLVFSSQLSWWLIGLPAFALQYPFYGLAWGIASKKYSWRWLPIMLGATHVVAVFILTVVNNLQQ